jgi:GT2 family glycosyltransferase
MLICHEAEPGLSVARNTALRCARSEWVVFLDDDAVAEAGWLAAYADFIMSASSARAAVAGGPVHPEFECPPPKWLDPRRDTLDWGGASKRVPARGGAWGCNIAYRRDAALQAGLFRTGLGRAGRGLGAHEETELNLRLEQAGKEIWWLPGARIRHHVSAERLRLRWRLKSAFVAGRSRAVVRLLNAPPGAGRCLWGAARLTATPFQAALGLLLAPLAALHRRGRTSANALMHAADTLGLGWGLLTGLCHRKSEP